MKKPLDCLLFTQEYAAKLLLLTDQELGGLIRALLASAGQKQPPAGLDQAQRALFMEYTKQIPGRKKPS